MGSGGSRNRRTMSPDPPSRKSSRRPELPSGINGHQYIACIFVRMRMNRSCQRCQKQFRLHDQRHQCYECLANYHDHCLPSVPKEGEVLRSCPRCEGTNLVCASCRTDGSFVIVDNENETELVRFQKLVRSVEQHPNAAGSWWLLGEALPMNRSVTINGRRHFKIHCYVNSVALDPDNDLAWTAIADNTGNFTLGDWMLQPSVQGVFLSPKTSRLDCRINALKAAPEKMVMYYNLGTSMRPDQTVEVLGRTWTQRQLFTKVIHESYHDPVERGFVYLCAYSMPSDSTLPVNGVDRTRNEILLSLLDDPETLNAIADLDIFAELGLLFPEHPVVIARDKLFAFDPNDRLGSGAFGVVFKGKRFESAEDAVGATVAVKQLAYEPSEINTIKALDEVALLTDPRYQFSIIQCYHVRFVPREKKVYIFMEFAQNGSVQTILSKQGHRFHESQLIPWFRSCISALGLLHRFRIVHQDLKPANLLVLADGTVKLADFGVSAQLDSHNLRAEASGTRAYMPPEALCDGLVTAAGDMWSIAATFVEMASGIPPVPDPNYFNSPGARPPFRPFIPTHLSTMFKEVLDLCLNYDHTKRAGVCYLKNHPFYQTYPDFPPDMESMEHFEAHKYDPGLPADVVAAHKAGPMVTQFGLTSNCETGNAPEPEDLDSY